MPYGQAGIVGQVKNSATDATQNFLASKIVAGVGITLTTLNPGGAEQTSISASAGANVLTAIGGTANAITATSSTPLVPYAKGQTWMFTAALGNTGAATIALDAKAARALTKTTSAGEAALVANDLVAGATYIIYDDGAQFVVINVPSLAIQPLSAVAGTANAVTANATGTTTPLAANQIFSLIPGATNTAAATLAINGGAAKNIFVGGAALIGGEMVIAAPLLLIYDGVQFNILNAATGSKVIPLSTVAGNGNAITANSLGVPALVAGQQYSLVPAFTNNSSVTLTLNGGAAKNVFFGNAACVGGEIIQSMPMILQYDGVQFQIIGSFVAASKATQQTGTNKNAVVTSSTQVNHDSALKTWGSCGVAGDLTSGFNVASVGDTGTGQATINLTAVFSSVNYACWFNLHQTGGSNLLGFIDSGLSSATAFLMTVINAATAAPADPGVGYRFAAAGRQ